MSSALPPSAQSSLALLKRSNGRSKRQKPKHPRVPLKPVTGSPEEYLSPIPTSSTDSMEVWQNEVFSVHGGSCEGLTPTNGIHLPLDEDENFNVITCPEAPASAPASPEPQLLGGEPKTLIPLLERTLVLTQAFPPQHSSSVSCHLLTAQCTGQHCTHRSPVPSVRARCRPSRPGTCRGFCAQGARHRVRTPLPYGLSRT